MNRIDIARNLAHVHAAAKDEWGREHPEPSREDFAEWQSWRRQGIDAGDAALNLAVWDAMSGRASGSG